MKQILCRLAVCFCLISALPACDRKAASDKSPDVFGWYMEQMGETIPNKPHTYILIPDLSCTGCRQTLFSEYTNSHSADTTIIISHHLQMHNDQARNLHNTIVDTAGLLNRLNWPYKNIVEVNTEKGEVIGIRDFTPEEMSNGMKCDISAGECRIELEPCRTKEMSPQGNMLCGVD